MYHFEWDQFADHQENLLDVCYNLQHSNNTSGVAVGAKRGLYESDFNFFRVAHESVTTLLEWCRASVFEAARHANDQRWPAGARIGIDVHESWCHITQRGGYHDMHNHPNSSWSGIFYVRAGESDLSTKNGCNRFYSPWTPAYSDIGTHWYTQTASIDLPPKEGGLVVFPSWLQHSALPYAGDVERVVIAFNCKFLDGTNHTTIDI